MLAPLCVEAAGNGTLADCQWPCFRNVSDSESIAYATYRRVTIGMTMPTVAACGVLFNLLSIFVFTRRSMRCSLNTYLSCLAASDVVIAVTAVLCYSVLIFECDRAYVSDMHSRLTPYVYPLSTVAQTTSVYITIAAAVDCFVATITPKHRAAVCKVTVAKAVSTAILLTSIVYNMPRFLELCQKRCFVPEWNKSILRLTMSSLRGNALYYDIYYTFLYTTVMAVGPLITLVILNACIITSSLRRSRRQTRRLLLSSQHNDTDVDGAAPLAVAAGDDAATDHQQTDGGGDTMTLVLVVCLFIGCNAPALLANLVEVLSPAVARTWTFSYMIDLSNLLVVCNASGNFLVYALFGAAFRRTLLAAATVLRAQPRPCNNTAAITTNNVGSGDGVTLSAVVRRSWRWGRQETNGRRGHHNDVSSNSGVTLSTATDTTTSTLGQTAAEQYPLLEIHPTTTYVEDNSGMG